MTAWLPCLRRALPTWPAVRGVLAGLGLGLLAGSSGWAQRAGHKPPPAPANGQPAPLPARQLEEALRLLLKADSVRRQSSRSGAESEGLVLDQTLTKLGRDFYELFYGTFQPPAEMSEYIIMIAERPFRGNNSMIAVRVNDTELLEMPLPTRTDQMEEVVAAAVNEARNYLQEIYNVGRQLDNGSRSPPERF